MNLAETSFKENDVDDDDDDEETETKGFRIGAVKTLGEVKAATPSLEAIFNFFKA